jgi:hypothetical protein
MTVFAILSPAKTMDFSDARCRRLAGHHSTPLFVPQAAALVNRLKQLEAPQLGDLLGISPKLATLNVERYANFDVAPLCAAVLAYQGDTYQGLAADGLGDADLIGAQNSLGLITGLYGILRPLDAIKPYRLEMATSLRALGQSQSLADFWRPLVTGVVRDTVARQGHQAVINLASQEYAAALEATAVGVPVITCDFKDHDRSGALKTIGLHAKRARGMMARFIITTRPRTVAALTKFNGGDYTFAPALSDDRTYTFVR